MDGENENILSMREITSDTWYKDANNWNSEQLFEWYMMEIARELCWSQESKIIIMLNANQRQEAEYDWKNYITHLPNSLKIIIETFL